MRTVLDRRDRLPLESLSRYIVVQLPCAIGLGPLVFRKLLDNMPKLL